MKAWAFLKVICSAVFLLYLTTTDTLNADSWARLFDLGPNESIISFAGAAGFAFLLGSNYDDPQNIKLFVIKVDQNTGNILWKYTYSYTNGLEPRSIYATTGGGCIVAADFIDAQTPPYPNVALVLKIDGSGNLEWKRTYRHNAGFGIYPYAIAQNSDGTFWLAGAADIDLLTGGAWVAKLSTTGTITTEKIYTSS